MIQKDQIQYTKKDLLNFPHESHINSSSKALGQVIWSDNFDDTSTWVIDNDGQSGLEFGWNINTTNEGWWSGNGINSTSGGANAELVNGNPTLNPGTQAQNVTYTLTTDSMIDIASLGGSNMCVLEFEQYGARFNDLQEVQISYDGTTFTTIGDNLDQSVLSSSGGSAYPNPMTKSINLGPILSATPQPFYLRFSWTTNYPSQATNANVWTNIGDGTGLIQPSYTTNYLLVAGGGSGGSTGGCRPGCRCSTPCTCRTVRWSARNGPARP